MLIPSGEDRCQSNQDTNKQDHMNIEREMGKYKI